MKLDKQYADRLLKDEDKSLRPSSRGGMKSRRTKRLHGTPQSYLSSVVDVRL